MAKDAAQGEKHASDAAATQADAGLGGDSAGMNAIQQLIASMRGAGAGGGGPTTAPLPLPQLAAGPPQVGAG